MSVRTSGGGQQPAGAAVLDGASAGSGSPAKRPLGLALVVIATAQLMVVLDATIVNVALPHIQDALGFSGSGLEWVVNAYTLTFGGLRLLGGRAGARLRRRGDPRGAESLHRRDHLVLRGVAARRLRHDPGMAAGRSRRAGSRRCDRRA